jgi:hypothetical protein
MSANLFFNYLYTADASQTTTLTVSGEQQDTEPAGITGINETVVVHVTPAELNALMVVNDQAGGSGGYGYPEVVLDWASVSSLNAMWTSFMAVGAAPIDFNDSESGVKKTLQKVFATETFEFITNSTSPLLTIPPEAVQNVDYSGAIELKRGATTLSPTGMAGASAILGEPITANTGELTGDDKKAVRGLFLQSLAAGRYKQSTTTAPAGSDLPADASPGFNFLNNDMVTFYTRLNLTKSRTFVKASDDDTVEGSAGMKFKVDGVDVTIGDGNTADDSVASDVKAWTVKWELKVTGGGV